MQVGCPNCGQDVAVPESLMTTGVARVSCDNCSRPFVIRVGEPNEDSSEHPAPAEKVELDGVTDSASTSSTAGEIGAKAQPAFIDSETRSSIKLSPELVAAAEQLQASPTVVDGALSVVLTEADSDAPTGFEAFGQVEAPPSSTAPAPAAPAPAVVDASRVPTMPEQDISAFASPATAGAAPPQQAAASAQPMAQAGMVQGAYAPQPTGAMPPPGYAPPGYGQPGWGPGAAPPQQMGPGYAMPGMADPYDLQPRESRAVRVIGMSMLLLITLALAFGLFVLARNDWRLDFSNLDRMLERALGGDAPTATRDSPREQLSVSEPALARHQFLDGSKVLAATGVVRNLRGAAKRYVYVRAELRQGDLIVASARAPAGNVFTRDELATMDKESLYSLSNPAGKSGRNAKIAVGGSVEYMVVFTKLPHDYAPSKYKVVTRVDSVEAHEAH